MIWEKHSLKLKFKKKISKKIKTASLRSVEEKKQYYSRPPQSIKPSKPSIILKIRL